MTGPVRKLHSEVIANEWGTLKRVTFELQRRDGTWQAQKREIYDKGDGAAVLMRDPARDTVILTRQFRLPAYLHETPGYLLEVPAGKLEGDDPETCIRREAEEETGYRITGLEPRGASYVSPGAITERIYLFSAHYSATDRVGAGGGLHEEGEDIEVVELPFDAAFAMIGTGDIVDAKSILLLMDEKLRRLKQGAQ